MYDGDIYLLSNSSFDDDDNAIATDKNIYNIELDDLTISIFDTIPESDETNFLGAELYVNDLDMLMCMTTHKENFTSGFPREKFYNPNTGEWTAAPESVNFLGVGWSDDIHWGSVYNGKYYTDGNQGGPAKVANAILEYTPPIF
ncbi:MAG TPA: hypothetical protein DCO79_07610 [Spirochaeta sp.]|nr:hypothetical protein [Spirochaeta sp.]